METKQKSKVELAADALIDKFYQQLKTATPTLNRPKYQSTQCAIQAQQMVVNALQESKIFTMTGKCMTKHKAILTELKSRL